jgi:hypothetical protein
MYKQFAAMLITILLCGCQSSIDKFIDRHDSIDEQNACKLDGPYKIQEVVSPNTMLVKKGGQNITVIIRGCIPTNDPKLNSDAESGFGWNDIYLLKNSIVWLNSKEAKAVVYKPANRVWIGRDENGDDICRILFYTMPQLVSIAYGYVILDNSDTDYPLYKVFKEAERLAKENKKGYWATHSE